MHLALRQGMITQNGIMQQARLAIDMYFDQEPLDRDAINEELKRLALAQTQQALARSRFLLQTRELLGLQRFRILKQIFARFSARNRNQP